MNERTPLAEPKKLRNRLHAAGLEKRRALLTKHDFSHSFLGEARFPRSQAGPDDVLDAYACAWTAARIFRGGAISFPADVPVDAKGLRMAIFTLGGSARGGNQFETVGFTIQSAFALRSA
jgi:predicted RNase H-like nuclease